jgi:hypothetical protein
VLSKTQLHLQNVGYPKDAWYGEYEFLDQDVLQFKEVLLFYVIKSTIQDPVTSETSQTFLKIPKQWLSKCKRYYLFPTINSSEPETNPENWASGLFQTSVYPNSSFMEWKLDEIFNLNDPSNITLLLLRSIYLDLSIFF